MDPIYAEELAQNARMQELERLVGEINMIIISPRSSEGKLSIIKALLRADIVKER